MFMKGSLTHYAIPCLAAVASVFAAPLRPADGAEGECLAIYAPKPEYPFHPSLHHGWQLPQGEGVFICHIDPKTGHVTSVSIAKGTGFAMLDNAAIKGLKRWRFRPNTCAQEIKIPVNFTGRYPTAGRRDD
jgi:TonB family protein